MNILFAIDEAAPLYKIGGLGDVGGALPKALAALDVDVRIIIPKHPEIENLDASTCVEAEFSIVYNRRELPVRIIRTLLPGTSIPVYLVDEAVYLSQHTDASDNHADKFSVFSLAIATWVTSHSPYWQPHLIHCHDWHTALVPVILKHQFPQSSYKTVISIHNLAYQGITTTPVADRLQLDTDKCRILSWDKSDGDINILLEGLLHADHITTVSPSYAKEILTSEYGEKVDHILTHKQASLTGILNGLDVEEFNPATDHYLEHRYDRSNWQAGKAANRLTIRQQLGLPEHDDPFMIGFVGRVDPYQKGIGLIIQAIKQHQLPLAGSQFIFLGVGDPALEKELHQSAAGNPMIKIITRFDEALARHLYAAAHLTLIPSRFEPCGLVQLIAMRYGSLPVARATGGLIDTINPGVNGYLFNQYSTEAMLKSLEEAQACLTTSTYFQMVERAMQEDFSWNTSAKKYAMLYQELLTG